MKKETILITGGAGFIGSHVAERLLKNGYRVVIIDDFNDYYNPAWKRKNIQEIEGRGELEVCEGSIVDRKHTEEVIQKEIPETIIHLAARAGVRPSIEDPVLYEKINIEGSGIVLEAAKECGVKNLILASSSSVYGNQKNTPFSENDPIDLPISPYAATKRAMELLAHTYHHLYDMNIVCLRFFTAYGERGRPDMAPYLFTEKILKEEEIQKFGNGSSERDYTYVEDIVEGVSACLGKKFGYEIINLGNNNPVSLNVFIETIERVTGKKAKIQEISKQPGDAERTYADIKKAKKILNWEPKTSLQQGLEKFITWYKENRLA